MKSVGKFSLVIILSLVLILSSATIFAISKQDWYSQYFGDVDKKSINEDPKSQPQSQSISEKESWYSQYFGKSSNETTKSKSPDKIQDIFSPKKSWYDEFYRNLKKEKINIISTRSPDVFIPPYSNGNSFTIVCGCGTCYPGETVIDKEGCVAGAFAMIDKNTGKMWLSSAAGAKGGEGAGGNAMAEFYGEWRSPASGKYNITAYYKIDGKLEAKVTGSMPMWPVYLEGAVAGINVGLVIKDKGTQNYVEGKYKVVDKILTGKSGLLIIPCSPVYPFTSCEREVHKEFGFSVIANLEKDHEYIWYAGVERTLAFVMSVFGLEAVASTNFDGLGPIVIQKLVVKPFTPTSPYPSVKTNVSNLSLKIHEQTPITFKVTNLGTPTNEGYLSISVSDGLEIVEYSNDSPDMIFALNKPGDGRDIYARNGSIIRDADQRYTLLDAYTQYDTDESHNIIITFRAIKRGDHWIKYRATFDNVNDPSPPAITDQQGWEVYEIPVRVPGFSILSNATVTPTTGTIETDFTFSVHYYSEDGLPPIIKYVYIDGIAYNTTLYNGTFSDGTYSYVTKLSTGTHNFYFFFMDRYDGWAFSQWYLGPTVGCSCTSWQDIGCGQGGCPSNQMYQTRTCTPSGCDREKQCVSHPTCGTTTRYVCKSGCPYSTIQSALNAANSGDTVLVTDGTVYYEQIVWPKDSLILNCNNATLYGPGRTEFSYGIVLNGKSGNTIMGCKIRNYTFSIYLNYSNSNTLLNNTISYNGWPNVNLYRSNSNTIMNNNISHNSWGFLLRYSDSNTLLNNFITDNGNSIILELSTLNTISNNTIRDNGMGILLDISSNSNQVLGNMISNNVWEGIWLIMSNSNIILDNFISDNAWGVHLSESNSNIISKNIFCPSNKNYDIYVEDGILNSGSDNRCDKPNGWYDKGTIGCTYTCRGPITITVCKNGSCDYTTIQAGLNATTRGDTVLVTDKETYREQIIWPSSGITLDCNGAILNGSGLSQINYSCDVIEFASSGIFMCRKKNNTIKNCNIYGYNHSIFLARSNSNIITNIISNNNKNKGVWSWGSKLNIINSSLFSNNDHGIMLSGGDSNIISGNMISNNIHDGIFLGASSSNSISNNIASNNRYGISLSFSSNSNVIENNTILKNINGIVGYSNLNTISKNNISNNVYDGIFLGRTSNSNVINNNMILDNNQTGMWISESASNTINDNIILRNRLDGILLGPSSNSNIVENNTISDNRAGINLWRSNSTKISSNVLCPSNKYKDFLVEDTENNTGTSNICNKPGSWNDTGTTGCTYRCPNNPPILNTIGDKTINENQLLQFSVSGSDPDGDILTYSVTNLPAGATFSGQTFSWTPNFEQSGTYYVTFIVKDGSLEDNETITILVNNVNRPPIISSFSPASNPSINEGQNQTFSVNASDPDNDILTIKWFLNNIEVTTGSSYKFVSNYISAGVYRVMVNVSDGSLSVAHNWTLTVNNVPLPDLTISTDKTKIYPSNPVANQDIVIRFTINNTGRAAASNVYWKINMGLQNLTNGNAISLAVNQEVIVYARFRLPSGTYYPNIIVDPNNRVIESQENNNNQTIRIRVA